MYYRDCGQLLQAQAVHFLTTLPFQTINKEHFLLFGVMLTHLLTISQQSHQIIDTMMEKLPFAVKLMISKLQTGASKSVCKTHSAGTQQSSLIGDGKTGHTMSNVIELHDRTKVTISYF